MAQTWSFVAAGSPQQNASSVTIPVPAGYAAGDLLVICMTSGSVPATPAGWTAVNANATTAFWKFASSSESSVTISVSAGAAVMLCYRGIGRADAVATLSTGTTSPATTNTQVTTADFDLVISVYGGNAANATYKFSTPTGTTSRVNVTPTLTGRALAVVDEAKATAGTTTARSSTCVNIVSWNAFAFSFTQGSPASMLIMF